MVRLCGQNIQFLSSGLVSLSGGGKVCGGEVDLLCGHSSSCRAGPSETGMMLQEVSRGTATPSPQLNNGAAVANGNDRWLEITTELKKKHKMICILICITILCPVCQILLTLRLTVRRIQCPTSHERWAQPAWPTHLAQGSITSLTSKTHPEVIHEFKWRSLMKAETSIF